MSFQKYRRHFVSTRLLKLEGLADPEEDKILGKLLLEQVKPPTSEERKAYDEKARNSIVITAENFRYDFTKAVDDRFNKDAIHVAWTSLYNAFHAGDYRQSDEAMRLPQELLTKEYIEASTKQHFQYLKSQWNEAASGNFEKKRASRLEDSRSHSRRQQVCVSDLASAIELICCDSCLRNARE